MSWLRSKLSFLLGLIVLGTVCSVCNAIALGKSTTAPQKMDLRAVWASTLSPCMDSPDEIRDLVKAVRTAHLNCVIAQVRHRGMTYYRSSIEPPAATWAGRTDFDPLQTLLAEAHHTTSETLRLDVYAWFNIFNFGKVENTSLSLEQRERIQSWLSYTTTGTRTQFLDPAVPEVQEYLLSLIHECVSKYPVDGVNLDFIRYPEEEAGYHPIAIARFQKLYGRSDFPNPSDEQWNEFRREQISGFVRRCAAIVWKTRPEAMVTVCAVGFGGAPPADDFAKASPYRQVHQDWASWAREGWVDIVTRMGYKREHVAAHAKQFRDWADYSVKLVRECPGNLITLGIGGYFNSADNVIVQYREAQRRGMGTSLFSYWRPTKEAEELKHFGADSPIWARIAKEVYPTPAAPPRPTWRKDKVTIAVKLRPKNGGISADGETIGLDGVVKRTLRADGNGWAIFPALPQGQYEVAAPKLHIRKSVAARSPGVIEIELP